MLARLAGLCLFVATLVAHSLSLHEEVHKLAMSVAINKFLRNFPVTFAVYNIHLSIVLNEYFFLFHTGRIKTS